MLWDQPAVDRSWSTDVHRKACPQAPSLWAADCQIAPAHTACSPRPGELCWSPLATDMCEQGGRRCQSVKNGNAQTINQYLSSVIHLFWNRNDSEPKMPTSLLVWVQTVNGLCLHDEYFRSSFRTWASAPRSWKPVPCLTRIHLMKLKSNEISYITQDYYFLPHCVFIL